MLKLTASDGHPGSRFGGRVSIHGDRALVGAVGSAYVFELPPSILQVSIDIKPGSDPNCFNNNGHGVIPVAILGSADVSVAQVDAATVQLEQMTIRMVGKSNRPLSHYEDVNGDRFVDLVVQIEDVDGVFQRGTTVATLTGRLLDGTPIEGQDTVCITR